jgi:4-aminobutyrate aminotransferase
MDAPQLKTFLPGPRAKSIIERDSAVVSPSYTRSYPFVMARGLGVAVEDVDGNVFLDCAAGIAVNSTGHSHPDVVNAVVEQAKKFLHMSGTDFYYEPQVQLGEVMNEIAPFAGAKRSFFSNSGTEAVEAALKLARYHTGRYGVIAFLGSFHGRTLGSLSLTSSKAIQRRGFGPPLSGVYHAPFPNPYRRAQGQSEEAVADAAIDYIEENILVHLVSPDEVAAVIVEPIQGEGGYVVPPVSFFQRLRELTQKHGILLIADEVQSGMGRTGKMFAVEHFGIEPDIVTIAKGIASGMPLGVTTSRAEIMAWPPGAHASTFGGNPVSCAAALATIKLLKDSLIANAATVGDHLMARLRDIQHRHPLVGDVRGKGLMIGIELVKNPQTKERANAERDRLVDECFKRGLLVLGAGRNTLRLCPPLVLTKAQADTVVRIIDESLIAVESGVEVPAVARGR